MHINNMLECVLCGCIGEVWECVGVCVEMCRSVCVCWNTAFWQCGQKTSAE